jgi:hypothetical protein
MPRNERNTTVLDPATLAERAAKGSRTPVSDPQQKSVRSIDRISLLGEAASLLDIKGKSYWVVAARGIILPKNIEPIVSLDSLKEGEDFTDHQDLSFAGRFEDYSKVWFCDLAHRQGIEHVSALCLKFSEAVMLPHFDDLPSDKSLHVPVLAVDLIDKAS